MNTFMAIMSQLFWGVTVGALTSTFSFFAKGVAVTAGVCGAGWWGRRWWLDRHRRSRPADKD
ncbi:hypothetical protein [Novosphingobium malaysiense]|uniref:Uncharacterized protein n=1 Tax=Novosphingobium malaysiense TaxID=1348853 RepID=A0A0B1ZGA7_9SPHN|nr:hypothetical protein [Novosphingobium malaysiense]KHK89530.1 hypothetical protein LK12_20745 [Novosphingobium malaysiense]